MDVTASGRTRRKLSGANWPFGVHRILLHSPDRNFVLISATKLLKHVL